MIKLQKHRVTCTCDDCVAMFPADRFEASWSMTPTDGAERVTGRVPLGATNANWTFIAYIDAQQRLVDDWPGFPGTRGARVELSSRREIVGTRDPALASLAEPVPLRRLAVERINARCMVELGLVPADVADFVACEQHGQGLPALACGHIIESAEPVEAIVIYGVDGDYPDLFCARCLERYVSGDLSVAHTVCSHCQQGHLYRHRLVTRTWYGAPPIPNSP